MTAETILTNAILVLPDALQPGTRPRWETGGC